MNRFRQVYELKVLETGGIIRGRLWWTFVFLGLTFAFINLPSIRSEGLMNAMRVCVFGIVVIEVCAKRRSWYFIGWGVFLLTIGIFNVINQ